MFHLFKDRVHEPVAVAGMAGAAAALHAAWMANLLLFRWSRTDTLSPLYLFVACVFVIIFTLMLAWCRGRDCSDIRDRVLHAFCVAVFVFLAMTFPPVYGFGL
jgi:hypothetical protein